MEDAEALDIQDEIRRAIEIIRLAQEILARLVMSDDDSTHTFQILLGARAAAQGNRLTEAELEVVSRFIEGQSPAEIAEQRGLVERTISNQLRSGCHKLGFSDRRELKGWSVAVNEFVLAHPPTESD